MKTIAGLLAFYLLFLSFSLGSYSLSAQAIAPEKSARAAAASDSRFISANIQYYQDNMFLLQKALERASDAGIKELAQAMLADHSGMLYSMEQLKAAGAGSSSQSAAVTEDGHGQALSVNAKLSQVSGTDFDTLWVSELLGMHLAKYDQLTQAKETVTNPQLKMVITEAIPLVRKHNTQLKSIQKRLIKMDIQKKKEAAKQKVK